MCSLGILLILGYFVVGFILISIFTRYATDRKVDTDEFAFGVFVWPIVSLMVISNTIDYLWNKYTPDYLGRYITWIQRNKK